MLDKAFDDGSRARLVCRKVDSLSFASQSNGYDCVPAALVNAAQIMGYSLSTEEGSTDFGSLRKTLGWPPAPAYVNMTDISLALNKLPKVVENRVNAGSSKLKISGGSQARFEIVGERSLSLDGAVVRLFDHVRKGQGLILGFHDHATVWAPLEVQEGDALMVHVDSMRKPLVSLSHWGEFASWMSQNSQYASPNGEHPVVFELSMRSMMHLRQYAKGHSLI